MNVKGPAIQIHVIDLYVAHDRVSAGNFTRDSDDVREKITTNVVCDAPYTLKQVLHLVVNMTPNAC